MSFKIVHAKIVSKLNSISKIQDVKTDPISDFSGYPACYVVESDSESSFNTNKENLRIYSWNIRLFTQVKDTDTGSAWAGMRDLVDDVLDAFDQDYLLSGISMPSGYDLMGLRATPSLWVYLEQEKLLMAEVKISAMVSVDVNV